MPLLRSLPSGTEPLPQIAAFAEAARLGKEAMGEACPRMAAIRSRCIEQLQSAMPDLVVIGGGAPHILSVGIPGGRNEVFINVLEQEGIYVSNSSACKRGHRSHVLEAMGIPPNAIDGALRISFSRFTTAEEADLFCQALIRARQRYFSLLQKPFPEQPAPQPAPHPEPQPEPEPEPVQEPRLDEPEHDAASPAHSEGEA